MGFLSPGAKQTVRNNEVSVLRGGGEVCKAGFDRRTLACLPVGSISAARNAGSFPKQWFSSLLTTKEK